MPFIIVIVREKVHAGVKDTPAVGGAAIAGRAGVGVRTAL